MSFSIILDGFSLFFICLLIHIIIWRLHHPKRQILTLFGLFLLFPTLFHFFIYMITKNVLSLNIGKLLQIYLLHYALSLAYIFSYPAAQAACPSFVILRIIRSSMPRGLTRDEIYSYCLDKKLFNPHVLDLVNENLVINKNGWLELTKRGRLILKIFIILRKLFGLPIGKG